MSFESLNQSNSADLIGGAAHFKIFNCLKCLDDLMHQMSLKSSKPFQVKHGILTPTSALMQLHTAVQIISQINSFNGWAIASTEHTKAKKTAVYALDKIQSILQQNQWFDVVNINSHPAKQQIQAGLDVLWNETRGYYSSAEVERDHATRTSLIREQSTENGKIVRRLLTKHSNLKITKLFGTFSMLGDFTQLELKLLEREMLKLKTAVTSQLQDLNQDKVYCIQWRIQRTLSGMYYLNVLVYHDTQHNLILPQDYSKLSHCFDGNAQHTLRLNLVNENLQHLILGKDLIGITHPEQWKVIFNNMLYPLRYYNYESKTIPAKFNSIHS